VKDKIEILVIEDEPVIQQTLEAYLDASGYTFAIAGSAPEAFELLRTLRPELFLCDIMLPGMNGFEICKVLKSNPDFSDIPLIFLTALHRSEQIIQGLEVGAVDYVTKPFNFSELEARIKTHLELFRGRKKLQEYTLKLECMNAEKDHFLGIAAHDLKNPLATILLRAQMTQMKSTSILPEKLESSMQQICDDAQRMLDIVTNLLELNRLETGSLELQPEMHDLKDLCQTLLETWQTRATQKKISLITSFPENPVRFLVDRSVLIQILDNLLSNAVKYSFPEKRIWFSLSLSEQELVFEIKDEGPGLTEEDQKKLFKKFMRLSAQPTGGESSTGLGLSIVKYLAEQLGGKIGCDSQSGLGSCFCLVLPFSDKGVDN